MTLPVPLSLAIDTFLTANDLTPDHVASILGETLGRGIQGADFYFQAVQDESWQLEDGFVKNGSFSLSNGFGCRVLSDEKSGFAYADRIDHLALSQAVRAARSIVNTGVSAKIPVLSAVNPTPLYPLVNPLQTASDEDKIHLLSSIEAYARRQDSRVKQVIANLHGQYEIILIIDTNGLLIADVRPLISLSVTVLAEAQGRREKGTGGGGARCDYTYFFDDDLYHSYVDKAVRQALLQLSAAPAPAGAMPVVLGAGWPAVLLHEAVGHGLEADVNRKGSSVFAGQLGKRVASPICQVVDDGTIPNRPGSSAIDDEGTPAQKTVLIENGILKNYMQDKQNAFLMGLSPTGNGRRQSYAHLPIPRMTNTCLLPGNNDPAEILASVEKGLYAVDFSGGQVDPTSGQFVFSASEAYLIEKGKVTRPVRGATLLGNGPEVLMKISMIGNDFSLDTGIGACGKAGQSVPVGVGQPTVKVDELTVGGTIVVDTAIQ